MLTWKELKEIMERREKIEPGHLQDQVDLNAIANYIAGKWFAACEVNHDTI